MTEKRFREIMRYLDSLPPLLSEWMEEKGLQLLPQTYYTQSHGWEIAVNVTGFRLTSNPFTLRIGRNGWVRWRWLIEAEIDGFRRVVRSPFYPLVRKFSTTQKPTRIPIQYLPQLGLLSILLWKMVHDLRSVDFLRVSADDKLSTSDLFTYARYLSGERSERIVVGIKSNRIYPSQNRYFRLVYYPLENRVDGRWGSKENPVIFSKTLYTYKDVLSFSQSIIKSIEIEEI